jgi:transposase-like protein
MSHKSRMSKDYAPDFREQAAKLVLEEEVSPSVVAKDLGIPVTSLHSWLKKFRDGVWKFSDSSQSTERGNASPAVKSPKLPSSSQKQSGLLRELEASNRELEIKLRRMTQERDILKKAMAYCLDAPK